jgi:hypothetical protein
MKPMYRKYIGFLIIFAAVFENSSSVEYEIW